MASDLVFPEEPNRRRSRFLDPEWEESLRQIILGATADYLVVDSTNAGAFLLKMWQTASPLSQMPLLPPCLSTVDQCNTYIQENDLAPLLAVVHEKRAYAWLIEELALRIPNPGLSPDRHTQILGDEVIEKKILSFEKKLEGLITSYLQDDIQLPHWLPTSGSEEIRAHIINLKIPQVSPPFPSLLLHNLGQPSHDKQLAQRVNDLFDPIFHRRFLCNASGSGKTRLLLEGLCRNWGLYFTARTKPECVGSSDLEGIIQDLKDDNRLMELNGENNKVPLDGKQEVTSRHFLRVLFARIFILRVFLERAFDLEKEITEVHKSRWLLFQIAPKVLLKTDPFDTLTRSIEGASLRYLEATVRLELFTISNLLPRKTLFCVLDEAQIPTNLFSNCFLSEKEPGEPRPILRQITSAWTPILPNLIVSGTSVSMKELQAVLGSAVAKDGDPQPDTITDLGAFDNEAEQRVYLEQYMPAGFLESSEGKVLAFRVGYWLHGRHRFTAAYLSRLIRSGFESPHKVLNQFIYAMTHFQPSDWNDESNSDIPILEDPRGFDFSKLDSDSALTRQIAGFIFDYIFNENPRDARSPDCEKLVEYGAARFVNLKEIVADEPLALLAAVHHFTTSTLWNGQYPLVDALTTSNASARGIALEHFGAYLLALAFKSPTPLSKVFGFVIDTELQHEMAELVAVYKDGDSFKFDPVDISSQQIPTYILGRTPRTEAETLAWLENPQQSVFCFPAHTIGPDLIMLLKLSNGNLLWVLIQFKHINENSIGPQKTAEAFNTTDPSQLISRRLSPSTWLTLSPISRKTDLLQSENSDVKNLGLNQKLQDALDHLDTGTDKAGNLGVLRVLISYPAEPDQNTMSQMAEDDESHHPIATVSITSLATHHKEAEILKSLASRVAVTARKRKAGNDFEFPGIKRKHTDEKSGCK